MIIQKYKPPKAVLVVMVLLAVLLMFSGGISIVEKVKNKNPNFDFYYEWNSGREASEKYVEDYVWYECTADVVASNSKDYIVMIEGIKISGGDITRKINDPWTFKVEVTDGFGEFKVYDGGLEIEQPIYKFKVLAVHEADSK